MSGETTSKDETELIKLFLANRNSILVMDSDKRNSKDSINTTKKRIKEEFENNGSIIWVTEGREIENYLSKRVINKEYGMIGVTELKTIKHSIEELGEIVVPDPESLYNWIITLIWG